MKAVVSLCPSGLGFVELDEVALAPDHFDALRLTAYRPILLTSGSDDQSGPSSSSQLLLVGSAVPSSVGLSAEEAMVHTEVLRRWCHLSSPRTHAATLYVPPLLKGWVREVEVELLATDGVASLDRAMGTTDTIFSGALRRRMAGKWACEGCTLLVSILGKTHAVRVNSMSVEKTEEGSSDGGAVSESSDLVPSLARFTRETRWTVAAGRSSHHHRMSSLEGSQPFTDTERQIRTLLELELRRKTSVELRSTNSGVIHAVLLTGVAGVGKWSAAQRVATSLGAEIIEIGVSSSKNNFEEMLLSIRKRCESNPDKRKLIVVRQLEVFATPPSDEDASHKWTGPASASGDAKTSAASRLLGFLDTLSTLPGVVVLGLLRQGYILPSSFLRPPRFDHSFTLPAPDAVSRLHILRGFFSYGKIKDSDLQFLAEATQGYVLRDLVRLSRRVTMHARVRVRDEDDTHPVTVTRQDMEAALLVVRPSQMFELTVRPPRVKWEDIAGCEEARRELEEAIKWGLSTDRSPLLASLPQQAGVLLYGPSGCGKTMCAHALASSTHLPFISVKGPELYSKYLGETESLIRRLFERARQVAPSIIFFDEIDALAPTRSGDTEGMGGMSQRVLSQLLNEMDGVSARSGVLLLACSSRPDLLDPALLRPGRLERLVFVGPPSAAARAQLLEVERRRKVPFADDVSDEKFAEATDGLTPAEILACCREAALLALTEDLNASQVYWRHIQAAIDERRRASCMLFPNLQDALLRYSRFAQSRPV